MKVKCDICKKSLGKTPFHRGKRQGYKLVCYDCLIDNLIIQPDERPWIKRVIDRIDWVNLCTWWFVFATAWGFYWKFLPLE